MLTCTHQLRFRSHATRAYTYHLCGKESACRNVGGHDLDAVSLNVKRHLVAGLGTVH